MWFTKSSPLLALFILFSLFNSSVFATKKSYIVYLGSHSHGPQPLDSDLESATESHYEFLGSFLGSSEKAKDSIFYSYNKHINGFAAMLEEEEAADIAKHPEVVSVFMNRGKKLHTTHSWDFMLLEKNGAIRPHSLWKKAKFGEDTIIANLDTGVWPESKSFSDEGYGAIPSRWKGKCENNTAQAVPCNRKLIGAKYYNQGYKSFAGKSSSIVNSARDTEGHGTHTLSTAGGNFVKGAKVFNVDAGIAKGGSPKARVASYKVCWTPINGSECFDADIMNAFDDAITDGVDVLSVSLGGDPVDYLEDGLAIGSFHAVQNGLVVVCSGGNSGPQAGTVSNVAPWIITVGASTLDRGFDAFVELVDGSSFKGASLSNGLPANKFYTLITGAQAKAAGANETSASLCKENSLDPKKVKGKILVCLRGENARLEKGMQAKLAGAVGMILCNDEASGVELIEDPHVLPASQLIYEDGLKVFSYIKSTSNPLGFITKPTAKFGKKPAPYMASFSSQGPNVVTPDILKPDITAPGVNIIAAYTEDNSGTDLASDTRTTSYTSMSGTSMSCPHVAGVVGLLKTMYPRWSSAAIRSAMMTTARTKDNTGHPILDGSFIKATPFSYGSGHIRPNRAMDPGLVYDLTTNDYLHFLCAIGYNQTTMKLFTQTPYKCPKAANLLDFNYPSISVSNLSKQVTVTRTLKNVGKPGTYIAEIREPVGVSVNVEPKRLDFKSLGEEKTFKLTLEPKWKGGASDYAFGDITWTDKHHYVRSPIMVSGHKGGAK